MQTHTQTYLHCLKSIDFLKIDPRVYLSNLHYRGIHIEEIHWVPDLIISKGNNEAKATKQQQVLASYIQYVSIYIVLAIHIYIYVYIYISITDARIYLRIYPTLQDSYKPRS